MNYELKGIELRNEFKDLVLDYMKSRSDCSVGGTGIKQSEIFRACGMDWGAKENCTSSNQQYWIVAILRTLEEENKVQRYNDTKKWRLK